MGLLKDHPAFVLQEYLVFHFAQQISFVLFFLSGKEWLEKPAIMTSLNYLPTRYAPTATNITPIVLARLISIFGEAKSPK